MPTFGTKSKAVHKTLHTLLQRLTSRVVLYYDISLLEGHRDEQRQNKLLASGSTKVGWPKSLHNTNPSMAVDVSPSPTPHAWGDLGNLSGKARDDAWKERVKFYQVVAVFQYVWGEMQADHEALWKCLSRERAEDLGYVAHRFTLRFGADWDSDGDYRDQTFDDLVHIEICPTEPGGGEQ